MTPLAGATNLPPAPRAAASGAARAHVRGESLRLSGAQPAVGRIFGRGESQSGQGLQLRLHLLPGRSHAARAKRGSSRPTQLLAELDDTLRLVASGELYRDGEVPRHAAAAAAAERHRLLRRRRADDLSQLRRDHRRLRRAEATALGLDDVKMVLITNASMFHRPHVAARAWRFSTRTTARSGPSSKRAPRSTSSSSIGRRFRSGRFSTTSPPPPACGRW